MTAVTWAMPIPTSGVQFRMVTQRPEVEQGGLVPVTARLLDEDDAVVATMTSVGQVMAQSPSQSHTPTRRVLCTVMFTDIVGSTELADELGDAEWRQVSDQHDALVRARITEFGGNEIKTTGDGFLVVFDSPSAAVACAHAASRDVEGAGLTMRAGINTGECEVLDGDIAGRAVHLAARIEATSSPGAVWVSDTTRSLVHGADMTFNDEGEHDLKGFTDPVRLWSLISA